MYLLKRKTSTGETRFQARVFAGRDQAGGQIFLVETFDSKRQAANWAHDREKERGAGTLVMNKKVTMDVLFDDLERYYKTRHKSTWGPLMVKAHLRPRFGSMRADQVTSGVIDGYVQDRQAKGIKDSTINRELGALQRAFRLAQQCTPPKVSRVPRMPHLQEGAPRQGFFEDTEYRALLAALPEEIKPVLVFAYFTGCRKSEILHLEWSQLDIETRMVRLRADQTKAKTARTIPLAPDLVETLRMQLDIRNRWHPRCPYVFFRHATGQRIVDIGGAWDTACRKVGLWDATAGPLNKKTGKPRGKATRILHDTRRTAVRNLTRSGVPDSVAMKISGHKTASIFRRYDIVAEADLADAARKLGAHIDSKRSCTPVVHESQNESTLLPAHAGNRLN
jgi:integrase